MTNNCASIRARYLLGCLILGSTFALAGYKARPWSIRERSTYPAQLTSEKVTIAVEPLVSDKLAAEVFDKDDILSRGIMPLAVVIFNDNDFPISVEGATVELIRQQDHLHTLLPEEVGPRLMKKTGRGFVLPDPIPRSGSGDRATADAVADLDHKFLSTKVVAAREKGGGFLYLHVPAKDVEEYLSDATLYIPNVYRSDTGAPMIFFEIELRPAVDSLRTKK